MVLYAFFIRFSLTDLNHLFTRESDKTQHQLETIQALFIIRVRSLFAAQRIRDANEPRKSWDGGFLLIGLLNRTAAKSRTGKTCISLFIYFFYDGFNQHRRNNAIGTSWIYGP